MVFRNSVIASADNSGLQFLRCLDIVGSVRNRGHLGALIRFSIKKKRRGNSYSKKALIYGLLVNTKKKTKRLDGSYISFIRNRAVPLRKDSKPVGSRVLTPICKEVRGNPQNRVLYKRLISLSRYTA